MKINLPLIAGTSFDNALNNMIGSINRDNNPEQAKMATHVAAAIGKFLIINHETEVGPDWLNKIKPLVGDIKVYDNIVDNLYNELVKRTKMKIKNEIQTIVSVYSAVKKRMWSKTAKRILGTHFFGNRTLTSAWEATFRKWWDEVDFIESRYGPIPMLDAQVGTMDVFFEDVVKTLFSNGYLTSEEHRKIGDSMRANRRSVIKPENPYAQAVIVKAFFEASLNRDWRKKFGSFKRTSINSDELFSKPLGSMLQGREEDQRDLDERLMQELEGPSEDDK